MRNITRRNMRFRIALLLCIVVSFTFACAIEAHAGLFQRSDTEMALESQLVMGKDISTELKSVVDNMNKARDTGDGRYYNFAESSLDKVFKIDPSNYDALSLKAWIQSGRHRFAQALETAKKASALRPSDSSNYGVMVDSLIELGRYDEAVDAAQKMVDLKPGMAAYSRIAYLRWFYGDPRGDIEMMKMAVNAGPPGSSETAWCIVQLGNEYFKQGQLDAAEEQYRRALEMVPDYIHALAGMGKIKAARKDYKAAIAFYQKANAKNPIYANVIALGDLYAQIGDKKHAEEQFNFVKKAWVRSFSPEDGLKLAAFYTDHGQNLAKAVNLAEKGMSSTDNVPAWDALAWAYYKNGMFDKARNAIKKALRLNTRDALLFFHAGMIYRAVGDNEQAKKYLSSALETNPYFDLNYPAVARSTLKDIRQDEARADVVNRLLLGGSFAAAILAILWAIRTRRSGTAIPG